MSNILSAQEICKDGFHEQYITGYEFYPYYLHYSGGPFYTEDWTMGTVKLISGEVYNNIKIKYDLYKDNFIYFNELIMQSVLIDKKIIDEVILNDPTTKNKLKLIRNSIDTTANDRFYFALLEGDIPLYMKKIKLIEEYKVNYQNGSLLGKFHEKTTYYFVLNNTFYQIPHRKRKFLSFFQEQAPELKRYMKKNKLSLQSQEDLTSIFVELNRLK